MLRETIPEYPTDLTLSDIDRKEYENEIIHHNFDEISHNLNLTLTGLRALPGIDHMQVISVGEQRLRLVKTNPTKIQTEEVFFE